jgi:DNA polymerase-1
MAYSNNARIELLRESAELERRLEPITQELNSYPLNVNRLTWIVNREAAEEYANFLSELCCYLADANFRPNSTADCGKVLFTDRGFKPKAISKKSGRASTSKDVLQEFANGGDSLAAAIIDARSAISCWSQLKAWHKYADAGVVQPTWDSLGTPHGRYTAANPCLCNRIPEIRETIEPPDGCIFLSIDLSMAEYCCWTSLSGDLNLGEMFAEGRDFHLEMAQGVKEAVPTWDHGPDLRQAGKTLNFALLYGMQPPTLAKKLNCSIETAIRITKIYRQRSRVASRYTSRVLDMAYRNGYVETFYGRRRYCPELQNGASEREKHEIEKTVWSHVNSGTTAEYLKTKQFKAWEALRKEGFTPEHARLSIQMYDGLCWTVRTDVLQEVRAVIEDTFNTKEPGFFLPFKYKIKLGQNWRECAETDRTDRISDNTDLGQSGRD